MKLTSAKPFGVKLATPQFIFAIDLPQAQSADIMKKPLPIAVFLRHRDALGMSNARATTIKVCAKALYLLISS